jgi:hypothetical protein
MTPPPTSIDGTDITGATIDGQDVQEITVDGQSVFTAGPPPNIIDNFEETLYDDQGNTLSDIYNGDLSSFNRSTTTPVFEGSYSLKINANNRAIFSQSGLNAYPSQGDVYSMRLQMGLGGHRVYYGVQSVASQDFGDFYRILVRPGDDLFQLDLLDGGLKTGIGSGSSANIGTNEWYELVINWQTDGTHTVTLNNQNGTTNDSFSGSDSTYSSGGIGWGSTSSGGSYDQAYVDIAELNS